MNKRILTVALSMALLLGVAGNASGKKLKKRSPKVIELDTIVVEGKIQKPEAFYILNRSDLDFKPLALRKSFLKSILRTLKSKPF